MQSSMSRETPQGFSRICKSGMYKECSSYCVPLGRDYVRDAQVQAKSGSLFLTLKRVERDFLKLLRNILGDHKRVPSHHSAYPLSQVAVHDRAFTMAAQISVKDVVDNRVNLDSLQIGADAVEMTINSPGTSRCVPEEDDLLDIAEAFATLRRDIFTALFATFVYEPLHYFIYGANVSYSLSPAMHNAAYKACGMPHTYGKHSSDTLDDFQRLAREPDFGGAAVVQPYKTGVLPLLSGLSSHASVIGSVNTILPIRELGEDGSIPDQLGLLSQMNRSGPVKALYGDNTDWIGIRAVLRRGLSPANTVRPQSTALVCGAGGQARSAVYAMLSLGVQKIFICNRTVDNARAVADHYNRLIESQGISVLSPADAAQCRVRVLESFASSWPKEYRQPSMIVSSIPTQAADGTPTNFTLPDAWLGSPTGGILIELAYRPMLTPIVKQMRAQAHRGWIMMDGFDILPEQAFAQFELFTGRRAPRELMRDEVLKKYREEQEHLTKAGIMDPNPPAT
ncbi:hypothetical protein B0A55_07672 [Friedmanniomyces simplex]|uniref:Quinate repressor protein n=1 Tax=Friedmanniomyces simplex TaxID=329884 RepID=A0A4U0X7T9_9PEZI|nr:hypothetical protein B0A55_07672 [Friedmanniomyces simplex]